MSDQGKERRAATRSVHSGEEHWRRSLTTPIAQTSTFIFEDMAEVNAYTSGEKAHFEYGRYGNPTREAAEKKLADIEGGEACVVFDSGMSAVSSTLFGLLKTGDHVIFTDDAYKKTLDIARTMLPRFGISSSIVPMGDYEAMEKAVRTETVILMSESPTNPYLNIADIDAVVDIAKRHGLISVIDSTFATPVNQKPLESGIDIVLHSATKYLAGHNDILAGLIVSNLELAERIREHQATVGGILDPSACYLLIRGLKTLVPRVQWQNASAMKVAQFLEKHPTIRKVYYPGLPSHRHHDLAKRYMTGYGGVVTFEVESDLEGTMAFCESLELAHIGPSLGGPETLITHPATVTYYKLTREERYEQGITDELVRFAVGLEDVGDIIADLEQGLDHVGEGRVTNR